MGLVVILLWQLVAIGASSPNLPSPLATALWITSDLPLLAVSTVATAVRALTGLGLAIVTGVGCGVVMAMSSKADTLLAPLVDFLRPLPSSALIWLFALWFGLDLLPLLIVWFGCTWPILLNTRDQMRTVPEEVHDSLEVLGMSSLARLRWVYSRALLPGILGGVRIAVSISLILAVTVELVVAPVSFFGIPHDTLGLSGPAGIPWGLGSYLTHFSQSGNATAMVAAVVMAGAAGALMNRGYHGFYMLLLKRHHLLER